MSNEIFYILRIITIVFAALMLLKYFIFLTIAPFHTYKERLRRLRLHRSNKMSGSSPLVSVIVPAWNEEVGIVKTIRSVLRNNYERKEIIVVNDGSTDGSHGIIQNFLKSKWYKTKYGGVPIRYFSKEQGGKGTALNHGIERANGEIILTIDADSVLAPDAIEKLTPYFRDSTIDAAVGQVKVAQNNTLIGLLQQLEYVFGFYYKRAHSVLGAEYVFGGACAAFRKEKTFDRLGLFDVATRTEDIEMSLRTRYHGLHAVYAEDVICYTEGASTFLSLINQRLRWKKGRFDTFIKYRRLFFSTSKHHNVALSWFVLPYALFSEVQLLFEPIGITLLVTYSIVSSDYVSLSIGILFVFLIYFVTAVFNHQKLAMKYLILFAFTWPLFYILVLVELFALLKSLSMIVRGDEVQWQKWARKGVQT